MRQTILHGDALNAARAAEAEAALAAEEAAAAAAEGAAAEAERLASNALATAAPTEDISAAVLAMKRSKPPKPVVNKPVRASRHSFLAAARHHRTHFVCTLFATLHRLTPLSASPHRPGR